MLPQENTACRVRRLTLQAALSAVLAEAYEAVVRGGLLREGSDYQ
jgi:hypothetical protein